MRYFGKKRKKKEFGKANESELERKEDTKIGLWIKEFVLTNGQANTHKSSGFKEFLKYLRVFRDLLHKTKKILVFPFLEMRVILQEKKHEKISNNSRKTFVRGRCN